MIACIARRRRFAQCADSDPTINGQKDRRTRSVTEALVRYADLEIGGAINEMLLQSHGGTMRICPARPHEWKDVSFQLRAAGAFLVTVSVRDGITQPFVIDSLAGKRCKLESPWEKQSPRTRSACNPIHSTEESQ